MISGIQAETNFSSKFQWTQPLNATYLWTSADTFCFMLPYKIGGWQKE